MLEETELLINELKENGFEVKLITEERDYPLTGKYTADCVNILRDGELIRKDFSRESYDDAIKTSYQILKMTGK